MKAKLDRFPPSSFVACPQIGEVETLQEHRRRLDPGIGQKDVATELRQTMSEVGHLCVL
jgi:hypothetical protein